MDFVDRFQHEVLSGAMQIDLLRRIKAGDKDALDELIRCNQRYIASICQKYANVSSQDVEFDDLMQAGNIGLLKAIEMWDENKNVQFSTYAYYWIRAKARRFAVHKSVDLSISYHFSERIVATRKARAQLLAKLKREPTAREIAEHLDLPVEVVSDVMRVTASSVRLDHPLKNKFHPTEERNELVQLPDLSHDTEEEGIRKAMIAKVQRSMSKLTDRQQVVISHMYGLNGHAMLSAGEIANKLGISRQAVDELAKIGLKRLRVHLTSFERA